MLSFPTFSYYFETICCFLSLGNFEVPETKSVSATNQAMTPAPSLFRMVQEFYLRVLVNVVKDLLQYKGNRGDPSNRKVNTATEPT